MATEKNKKTLHIVLQAKGGVGKSFISIILAQYLRDIEPKTVLIDTDPSNRDLKKVGALNVTEIDLINPRTEDIDPSQFDLIVEQALESNSDHVLVDTGSNTFIPLTNYIRNTGIIPLMDGLGFKIAFHFVITGGVSQDDCVAKTLAFMSSTIEPLADSTNIYKAYKPLYVWINTLPDKPKFETPSDSFLETDQYLIMEPYIEAVINIPDYRQTIFHADILKMNKEGLTFEQTQRSKEFNIVSKHRLKKYKDIMFTNISLALSNPSNFDIE